MMLSKGIFTKTRILLLVFFIIFSFIAVSGVYLATSAGMKNKLTIYKKEYFIEQAHNMVFFINEQIDDPLKLSENNNIFDRLTNEFSIPFDIYSKDLSSTIYQSEPHTPSDIETSVSDIPIIIDGVKYGYLKAYYDNQAPIISPGLAKYERAIEKLVLIVSIIIFTLLVIISFIASKYLAKPEENAAKSVDEVIKGNREVRIPRGGTTESRLIIDGINSVLIEFRNMENWRKQMMEDLAHELRTPLTSVLAIMEAMLDGIYPTNSKYLQEMYDEVDRLSRLLINVENLSEAESARFKLNLEEINLITLIKSTYGGFLFVAQQKNIDFHLNYPNRPCLVEVDPDRFIQVITNIISNALKYTPEGGIVEIGTVFLDNEVEFYCQDNGIGISEEEQQLVFNRFYRVEKSRSRQSGGSGIGLNVSQALAEAQGWDIGVSSELNVGSRFWVRIPLKEY